MQQDETPQPHEEGALTQALGQLSSLEGELASREVQSREQANALALSQVLEVSSIAYLRVDENGLVRHCNPAFSQLLGLPASAFQGKALEQLVHLYDRQRLAGQRAQLAAKGEAGAPFRIRLLGRQGPLRLLLSLVTPFEPNEDFAFAAVVLDNLAERWRMQEALGRIVASLARQELTPPVGTWNWHLPSDEVEASDAVYAMFGMPRRAGPPTMDDFLGRIHPDDLPGVKEALAGVATRGKPVAAARFRVGPRMLSSRSEVFRRLPDGSPALLLGMVEDITAHQQATAAMSEHQRRLEQLFTLAADPILILSTEGRLLDANRAACELLLQERGAILGHHWSEFVALDDRQARKLLRHARVGDVLACEAVLSHDALPHRPLEISARRLPDRRWMAIARDVSERKRAQEALQQYANEVRDLYENAPCGYHSLDAEGRFTRINRTELEWLGYEAGELLGHHIKAVLSEESQAIFDRHYPLFKKFGRLRDLEMAFRRKDGSELAVLVNATSIYDSQGAFLTSRSSLFDISELKQAQQALRRAAAVFEHSNDGIIITDAQTRITAVNQSFTRITGYSAEDVLGKTPAVLSSGRQNDEFYQGMWQSLDREGSWRGEIWDKRKDGSDVPLWESISIVRDAAGRVSDYIAVFSDISSIKHAENQLLDLAYRDPLTGLPNRSLFKDRAQQAVEHVRRHGGCCALMLLDLDRFKNINDTLGHPSGDKLLCTVATRLQESLRADDTVARLGGDEFAVLITDVDAPWQMPLLAQKVVSSVARPLQLDGHEITVSTSVGVALAPDDAHDADALVKAADMALYDAKEGGRNQARFYRKEMTERARRFFGTEHGLRRALEESRFELMFQPQLELMSAKLVGMEALVRWRREADDLCSPADFIPVAEETGLICEIGRWVLRRGCAMLREWHARGVPPVRLALNVSVRQLREQSFVQHVLGELKDLPTAAGFGLELEVTESALQTAPEIVAGLAELHQAGVRIAIDDFGTGYSSLSSLKHLPVDTLKIDRSFVRGIPADKDNAAITSAIIAMGHSLGLEVIAEGIEEYAEQRFLLEQDCDQGQGFLFSPPLSARDCISLLALG